MKMQEAKPAQPAPHNHPVLKSVEGPAVLALIERDDLLQIDGIDPATEMALNSIGVRRFADFEGYTPEALAKALQERTGLTVVAETIGKEDWIGAAAIFATVSDDADMPAENHELQDETSQPTALPAEQTSAEPIEEVSRMAAREDISAQNAIVNTVVSDTTTDADKDETGVLQTAQNEERGNGALWIQHAAFTPVETPAKPNQPAASLLRSEIMIGAGVMAAGAEGTPLCTQIHAVDAATGEHEVLAAQTERLQRNQTDYPVQLEFPVPGIGRYQLHIIAFLLQPKAEIAFYQGPILRVVA